jgi:rod shape-determining protein MreC
VIVSFSLGLISFTSPNRQSSTIIEKTIRDIYTPLQSGVNGVFGFFRGFGSFFTEKQGLIQKVKDLEAENDRLKLENQALREETDELLRLRSLVNFTDTHDQMFSFTAARVIARSPNNWCKILTINRGSEHGIRKDMAVISPDGLVGRIGSVSQKSSQVYLITDREVAVGAILQRTRETSGIVEGKGESYQLWMKNIPYYSDIRKGDRVITSGLSEYYPKGILIGTVKQTKKEPGGLLLSAIITPGVDFSKLEEVLVVTNYIPPAVNITVDQEEQ